MTWTAGDVWRTEVLLPAGQRVEYKYVILEEQDWTKLENEDAEGLVEVTYRSGSEPGEPPDVTVGAARLHPLGAAGRGGSQRGALAARGASRVGGQSVTVRSMAPAPSHPAVRPTRPQVIQKQMAIVAWQPGPNRIVQVPTEVRRAVAPRSHA